MSVRNPHNLRVGSTLYYVPNGMRGTTDARTVIVTKIGHKWVTCGEGWSQLRADMATLRVDGGMYPSPGTCYLSEERYKEGVYRVMVYRAIGRVAHCGTPPESVTTQQLCDFAVLIGAKP